jgi:sigma-B regulation protein RsbU (phosphoserine phosphatase)
MTIHNNQDIPTLGTVMRIVAPVYSGMLFRDVVAIFQNDPALLMLPVTDNDALKGVISRRDLFSRYLSRPFAMELYGKKPISMLISGMPLVIAPECDVNSALACLLEHDPALDIDSFPVMQDGKCVGIVHVAELLMAISRSQARLLAALGILNARICEEVDKARQIQRGLLPPATGAHAGLVLDAVLINSSEISGDVYDYFVIDDNRLGVMVGDVSGHGVQSGMVATAAKAGLHLLLGMGVTTPGELLSGMNKAVAATASDTLLMTAVIAVIDRTSDTVLLANAGHNYPFLYSAADGEVTMLDGTGGFPLGFDPEYDYEEIDFRFRNNDRLFFYSDGIIEARNRDEEEFGYDRLRRCMQENLGGPPESFRTGLLETIRHFTGTDYFEDDVTLVVVAEEAGPEAADFLQQQ